MIGLGSDNDDLPLLERPGDPVYLGKVQDTSTIEKRAKVP